MGRARRINVPGWHHVTCRAVDEVDVLAGETEKELFARQLGIVVRRFHWSCLSYCLMSNHYLLLLRLGDATLTRGVHRLNSVFRTRVQRGPRASRPCLRRPVRVEADPNGVAL